MVVTCRPCNRPFAGFAQLGKQRSHERARPGRRQLAVALDRRAAAAGCIRLAGGFDEREQPIHGSSSDRWIARAPRNRGDTMKATQLLYNLGQSIWLDNITRDLLDSGTLKHYIDDLSVTGLTSNPTIFDHAIKNSSAYDTAIVTILRKGKSGEGLFFELALDDITRAAQEFRPTYDKSNGVDGWVSLEVSPLLAHDTASTVREAKDLYARAARPNLFIKIPGTKEGLPAIEAAI